MRKTRQLGKRVSHLLLYLLPITTFHLVVMKYFYFVFVLHYFDMIYENISYLLFLVMKHTMVVFDIDFKS